MLANISHYLQQRLKLEVNASKSHVVKTSESKCLGFTFKAGKILIHPKTLQRFKQQVRRLTNRNWGVALEYQLFKISQYLRGWINYFGIANSYQLCVELDQWIRGRVRMASWRQWRKPRTKVQNLMSRGVHVRIAVACGITMTQLENHGDPAGVIESPRIVCAARWLDKASLFQVKRAVRTRTQGVVGAGG